MSFEHRQQVIGLVLGSVLFLAYWAVIVVRAAGDGLPFTQVDWQAPMLWALIIGGVTFAVTYGVSRFRARGTPVSDERDTVILMHGEASGSGIVGITVLATLIMLTLGADTFWVAHVLFVGSFLGSLATAGVTISGYRNGEPA
ncbi:hypothetical protein [Demequina aurantiaca]|uniref:hypothetical protein n=1 Tax=Demequina aurantiaca TaxID=676200 RepID=UPI0007846AF5|nr:hypothetical protein [Demequina aurantiaca]